MERHRRCPEDGGSQRRQLIEPAPASVPAEAIRAVPVRHWGRWVTAVVVVVLAAWFIRAAVASHFVDGHTVGHFLFSPLIVKGARNTVVVAVLSQTVGVVLGVLLAVMRITKNPVLKALSGFYIWFFRGTPVLLQLFFWFNGVPSVFKTLTISIPFTHVVLYSTPMTSFMTPFMAAFLGLALNEGAYMAEIVRAGILSVDDGQVEAASALGMTSGTTTRRIVLPQAMRVIIPPTGNEFISMLKTSSLASTITYVELLRAAGDIYSTNLQPVPLLVDAAIWYLAMTTVASVGQYYIERHYERGRTRDEVVVGLLSRIFSARRQPTAAS